MIPVDQVAEANSKLDFEAITKRLDWAEFQSRARLHDECSWRLRNAPVQEVLALALNNTRSVADGSYASGLLRFRDMIGKRDRHTRPEWIGTWAIERPDSGIARVNGRDQFDEPFHEWANTAGVDCLLFEASTFSRLFVERRQVFHRSCFFVNFPTENDAFTYQMRWRGAVT